MRKLATESEIYECLRNSDLSKSIGAILNFMEDTKSAFYANYDEVNRQDKLSTDRSHQLELKDMTDEEILDWAHAHRDELRERRGVKDSVAKATPLVDFIEGDSWSAAAKDLRIVLGQLRSVEQSMSNRLYRYKVLNESDLVVYNKPLSGGLSSNELYAGTMG